MKSLIERLYYGYIPPFWELDARTAEYDEKTEEILAIWEDILEKYPDVEPLLEQYRTAHYEAADIMCFQQFLLGMRTGAQLVLELMQPVEKS